MPPKKNRRRKKKPQAQSPSESAAASEDTLSKTSQGTDTTIATAEVDPNTANPISDPKKLEELNKMITKGADPEAKHDYWDTQPMPKIGDLVLDGNGPIEKKTLADVRKEPLPLNASFEWIETDLNDPTVLDAVYTLLTENYVEDDDNMFRFDYSREFLKWAIQPPGYLPQWHIAIRVKSTGKLVAFITAIPALITTYRKPVKMVEINFLCVHKKLRAHSIAPKLISEITRRVNLQNIWQAVYTAGKTLPRPVAKCRYFHRSLNPKKLTDVKFSHLTKRLTLSRAIKLYRLPTEHRNAGFRPLVESDVRSAFALLSSHLEKYALASEFSEDEFRHWFLPREGIVHSYVIDNGSEVTDFVSFYSLPSTIIGHPRYHTLRAAYSFYNIATSVPLKELVHDALIAAKNLDFDVFNCLDVMQHREFLEPLNFGKGDGHLHYYIYNWRCPPMEKSQVGLVLM